MRILDAIKSTNQNPNLPFFNSGEKNDFFDFQGILDREEVTWFQTVNNVPANQSESKEQENPSNENSNSSGMPAKESPNSRGVSDNTIRTNGDEVQVQSENRLNSVTTENNSVGESQRTLTDSAENQESSDTQNTANKPLQENVQRSDNQNQRAETNNNRSENRIGNNSKSDVLPVESPVLFDEHESNAVKEHGVNSPEESQLNNHPVQPESGKPQGRNQDSAQNPSSVLLNNTNHLSEKQGIVQDGNANVRNTLNDGSAVENQEVREENIRGENERPFNGGGTTNEKSETGLSNIGQEVEESRKPEKSELSNPDSPQVAVNKSSLNPHDKSQAQMPVSENNTISNSDNQLPESLQNTDPKSGAAGYYIQEVVNDSLSRQEEVKSISENKEQQIEADFSTIEINSGQEFEKGIQFIPGLLETKRVGFLSLIIQKISGIQILVMNAFASGFSFVSNLMAGVNNVFSGITGLARSFFTNATNRVLTFIDSIPIPDIPGIRLLRDIIRRMIGNVIGFIQQIFSRFRNKLLNAIRSVIRGFLRVFNFFKNTIQFISNIIARALLFIYQRVSHLINRFIRNVLKFLRSRFFSIVKPFIRRIKKLALQFVRFRRLKAIREIVWSSNYHIIELHQYASENQVDENKKNKERGDGINSNNEKMELVKQRALQTNKSIVERFRSGVIENFRKALKSVGNFTRVLIVNIITQGLHFLRTLEGLLIPFMVQVFQTFTTAISNISRFLISFTHSVLQMFQTAISMAGNLLTGLYNAIGQRIAEIRDRIIERIRNFVT